MFVPGTLRSSARRTDMEGVKLPCELSCQRGGHGECMSFPQEGLGTPAEQQGREYEAANFRCKAKSNRSDDLQT